MTIALLGGSFDPVHKGHVALASLYAKLLGPCELRIVPAGCPWQKGGLHASAAHRVAMIELAFDDAGLPFSLDRQEIERGERGLPSYTVDTLTSMRAELGDSVAIVFLMGADQLRQLDSWHQWQRLFELAHIGVATRPGAPVSAAMLPASVAEQFTRRLGSIAQLRGEAHGLTFLVDELAVDISATQIRAALQRGESASSLISPVVLDYIQQHNLYKS